MDVFSYRDEKDSSNVIPFLICCGLLLCIEVVFFLSPEIIPPIVLRAETNHKMKHGFRNRNSAVLKMSLRHCEDKVEVKVMYQRWFISEKQNTA